MRSGLAGVAAAQMPRSRAAGCGLDGGHVRCELVKTRTLDEDVIGLPLMGTARIG